VSGCCATFRGASSSWRCICDIVDPVRDPGPGPAIPVAKASRCGPTPAQVWLDAELAATPDGSNHAA
jgi:hypothetical protein